MSRLFHQSVNLKEDALVKRQKKWFQFLWDLVISSFVPLLPICKQKPLNLTCFIEVNCMWKGLILILSTKKHMGLILAGAVVSSEKCNLHFFPGFRVSQAKRCMLCMM